MPEDYKSNHIHLSCRDNFHLCKGFVSNETITGKEDVKTPCVLIPKKTKPDYLREKEISDAFSDYMETKNTLWR
jgi:hypothetical protein